ncbi:unnamed protein product [Fusarium langsethiae]|nr:unnamed protein product [Fusarium langsethiae]
MEYSVEDRKAVYTDTYCRQIFKQQANLRSTAPKSIRSIIRDYRIAVADFSESKLVAILQHLIWKGVFVSAAAVAREFTELSDLDIASLHNPTKPLTEYQPCLMKYSWAWLHNSFDKDEYSDLTLVSQSKRYFAHRVIVCPQSSVIAKKCQFQDDIEGCPARATPKYSFDFGSDDPQAIDCLIQHFYQQNYQSNNADHDATKDLGSSDTENAVSALPEQDIIDATYPILHARVYALAELYDIPALKATALEKFKGTIQDYFHPGRFLDGVEEAYVSTIQEDRGLRDVIVKFFYTHPDLLKQERVTNILQDIHPFTYDLFMYWDKMRPK